MKREAVRAILQLANMLTLVGVLVTVAMFCAMAVNEVVLPEMFALPILTLGAGALVSHHAKRHLAGEASESLRLPAPWLLLGVMILALIIMILSTGYAPVATLVAAALPPAWALSWFTRQGGRTTSSRRCLVALAGGATLGVALAILLEALFPAAILALIAELADSVLGRLDGLLSALANQDVAAALSGRGFLYAMIHLALIAPLVEELVKPLVAFPILGRLEREEAFIVGAFAGAGFAAVENVIYAAVGRSLAPGILLVRSLGGAIHPLGAGLVALGWRELLRGESGAGRRWFAHYAAAVGLHALWNGGSLLVIALAGARFFGAAPPELDLLGVSAGATTLVLLLVLGLVSLWAGGRIAGEARPTAVGTLAPGDRSLALWAVACLAALVPAGIAGLKIVIR